MIKNFIQKNIKKLIVTVGIGCLCTLYFYNSYYFDFDRIEHYKIIREIDYFDRNNEAIQITHKDILSELLFDFAPKDLKGKIFLNTLEKVTTIKQDIPTSDFDEIREIFKEQNCSSVSVSSCIPVFRDIFIFYKNNDVVGIAKICFGCRYHHIIGTTSNTSNFGQCGNYEALQKIL